MTPATAYALVVLAGLFSSAEECEQAKRNTQIEAEIVSFECVIAGDDEHAPASSPIPLPKPDQNDPEGEDQ